MEFDEPPADIRGVHLSALISAVRNGKRRPIRFGERVPVVRCRVCNVRRPDDGTRCYNCDAYQGGGSEVSNAED